MNILDSRSGVVPWDSLLEEYVGDDRLEAIEATLADGLETSDPHARTVLAWHLRERDPARVQALALELAQSPCSPPALKARAQLACGHALLHTNAAAKARDLASQALDACESIGDMVGMGDACRLLAAVAFTLGEPQEMLGWHRMAAERMGQCGDPLRAGVAQLALATALVMMEPDTGNRLLEDVRARGGLDHPCLQMQLDMALAQQASLAVRFKEAAERFAQSYRHACTAGAHVVAAVASMNAGASSINLQDFATALEWVHVSAEVARSHGNVRQLGATLAFGAIALRSLDRQHEARTFAREALSLIPFVGSRHWIIALLAESHSSLALGEPQAALDALIGAESACRARHADVLQSVLSYKAEALCELGRFDEALQAADEVALSKHGGNRADSLRVRAKVARALRSPPPAGSTAPTGAIHWLEAAIAESQKIDDRVTTQTWLLELSLDYEAAGDPVRALALERQAHEARRAEQSRRAADLVASLHVRQETERIRAEAAHHKALAEAQAARADAQAAANEAKSRFLANMSHELRSPLNAMLGFTRLLLRAPDLAAHADDLGIVLRSGEHLHGLINQVLEMSKIEAGHAVVVEGDFDLAALVDEVLEMQRPAASQKGLALQLDALGMPRPAVRGDATKLRQVLVNLVGNAVKFTNAGSVTLSVAPDGPRWHFTVRDTGVGIAADDLARLGHAFVQAEAGRRAAEGTGLGLAISRRLVALMGGELRLASTPGQGTEAGFSLELAPAQQPHAPEPAAARIVGLAPGTAPQRVLIVEDRPEGRLLLRRTLQPLGFELREAADGAQALDTWQAWQPQLVLMDIQMAGMDGHEATRRIKATELGRGTVVIALTASCFEEQRDEVLASGCDDFMRKPFQEAALLEMIARHLRISYVRADATAAALVDPARVEQLPADLREALRSALERLDVGAVEQALERLHEHDALTADAMAVLASSYRYDALRSMLIAESRTDEPQSA
jgi:signal transduction histidine kinase/DNA-binding response OmpR family regulator